MEMKLHRLAGTHLCRLPHAPETESERFPAAGGDDHRVAALRWSLDDGVEVMSKLNKQPGSVRVAMDRATRFVWEKLMECRDAATVSTCLREFLDAFPHPAHTLLTDKDSAFTDRRVLHFGLEVNGGLGVEAIAGLILNTAQLIVLRYCR